MNLQKHDADMPHIRSFSSHGESPRLKTAAQMVQHMQWKPLNPEETVLYADKV
jgi:hypothetical protein